MIGRSVVDCRAVPLWGRACRTVVHGGSLVEAPTKDASIAKVPSEILAVSHSHNDDSFNDGPIRIK